MASVWNAARNVLSDNWWAVKVVFMAAPIFFLIDGSSLNTLPADAQIFLLSILSFCAFGVIAILMHRNINNLEPILPSLFSLRELLFKSFGMLFVSFPSLLLYYFCFNALSENLSLPILPMSIIFFILTLFFLPFIVIPCVLYSVNGKILEAYYFRSVVDGGGNFIVQMLSFIIQYFFTIFILFYLFYALFTNLTTDTTAVNILYSITIVFSVLVFFSYCSDMYGETIPSLPKKNDD